MEVSRTCLTNDDQPGITISPTRTLFCGDTGAKSDAALVKACTPAGNAMADRKVCFRGGDTGALTAGLPFATAPVQGRKLGPAHLWCPGDVVPVDARDAIRAEAIRLLPKVEVGSAWRTRALVRAEVVLWADTAPRRELDAARVLGTQVRLQINFAAANWNFGDGSTDRSTDPGKPYDGTRDPCRTVQCADYYGHTYTRAGRRTISVAVSWTARFSVDDGATWTDLGAPITGPRSAHTLTVVSARGVLTSDH